MKKSAVTLFVLVLAACGSDETTPDMSTSDAAINDSGTQADMAVQDSGTTEPDQGTPDAGAADTGTDSGSSTDQGTDAGSDAGTDLGVDAGTDMSEPDLPPAMDGCAAGFTPTIGVAGQIVACAGPTEALNQCDAEAACGAGWHMCTATEYRAHYEAVEPAAADTATFWLAACVRNGADPISPLDTICADCTGTQTGSSENVAFSCINALRIESSQLYVGLRAGTACTFAGEDIAGNDAYWNAQNATQPQNGAFCCPN